MHPAIWEITAKAESWPVEPARAFWRIWGSLENRDRGSVESCRKARDSLGTEYRAIPVAIVEKNAAVNLEEVFWE
jgi:hypothetical protein